MALYRLLPEDRAWIEAKLSELQAKIKDLGPEFHEVLNQSSETWHDNAPFDAVRDKQSLIYAEFSHLKYILLNSQRVVPRVNGRVEIGSHVTLTKKDREHIYFIAGDWTHQTGERNHAGATVVTAKSPLALELLGKKIGDETEFGVISRVE